MALTTEQQALADRAGLAAYDEARRSSNLADERVVEAKDHAADAVALMSAGGKFDPATEAPEQAEAAARAWAVARMGGPDAWLSAVGAWRARLAEIARADVRI